MELKLADNPTIEIVSEKAFLDALEKTNADALETLSEKQEEYKRIWSTARSVGRDFHGLTDGQKKAFDLVKEGKNVYLTGLAGTGKSYIVERIIEWAQTSGLNVITCAPTGIAALNVGGSTVHRVLCIRPGRTLEKDPHPFVPTDSPLPDCDLLILDEVSMCRMDLFDYLSAVLKIAGKIRKQKGKGLCQLLVVGDFCQLPPVITNEERRFLEEKYGYDVGEAFAFQSSEWAFWNFEEVELCEAIRQRDAHFVAALMSSVLKIGIHYPTGIEAILQAAVCCPSMLHATTWIPIWIDICSARLTRRNIRLVRSCTISRSICCRTTRTPKARSRAKR